MSNGGGGGGGGGGNSYSVVAGWIQARLLFAILRSTNLCLRDSPAKWRSNAGIDYACGAGLLEVM